MAVFVPDLISRNGGTWHVSITLSNKSQGTHADGIPNDSSEIPSLNSLCEKEVKRRLQISTLSSQHKKTQYQIGFSAYNAWDLEGMILMSQGLFKVDHIFEKNSSLNGYSYQDQNKKEITLTHAITSSSDTTSSEIAMMRRIVSGTMEVICFVGRPETGHKIQKMAALIGKHSGIKLNDQNEMPFLVTSLMTTSPIGRFRSREPKLLEEEIQTFEHAPAIAIDKERPWIPRPILVAKQVNFFSKLEKILPGFFVL